MSRFLTVEQCATELTVSKMQVYRLIHDGTLPATNIGKRSYRIRPADLEAYIDHQAITKPRLDEDELTTAIVSEFESWGQAWWTDDSGDILARVAARAVIAHLEAG